MARTAGSSPEYRQIKLPDGTVPLRLRRGRATDFVTKPVDAPLLDLRIRRAFDLEQTHPMANTDSLTGLYDHRHLIRRRLSPRARDPLTPCDHPAGSSIASRAVPPSAGHRGSVGCAASRRAGSR